MLIVVVYLLHGFEEAGDGPGDPGGPFGPGSPTIPTKKIHVAQYKLY